MLISLQSKFCCKNIQQSISIKMIFVQVDCINKLKDYIFNNLLEPMVTILTLSKLDNAFFIQFHTIVNCQAIFSSHSEKNNLISFRNMTLVCNKTLCRRIKLILRIQISWRQTALIIPVARDLARLTSTNLSAPNSQDRREALSRSDKPFLVKFTRFEWKLLMMKLKQTPFDNDLWIPTPTKIFICQQFQFIVGLLVRYKFLLKLSPKFEVTSTCLSGGASPKISVTNGPMSIQPHMMISAQSSTASSLETDSTCAMSSITTEELNVNK